MFLNNKTIDSVEYMEGVMWHMAYCVWTRV